MSLGDFFPEKIKNNFAKRNIDLGCAILIKIPEFSVGYEKYIIIVAKDEKEVKIAYVVINSEANENVSYNKYLQSLHVKINKKNSPFLERDSYVDCSTLREFPMQYVVDFLTKNPNRAVGNVSDEILREIHLTITRAKTITPIIKKSYGFM